MGNLANRTFGTKGIDGSINYEVDLEVPLWHENESNIPRDALCPYCGHYYDIKSMKIVGESKTGMGVDSNILGGYIYQKQKHFVTLRCQRCDKIHGIAFCVHLVIGIVLIWLAIHLFQPRNWDNYIAPIAIGFVITYIISTINWFFIKRFLKVRRKPKEF